MSCFTFTDFANDARKAAIENFNNAIAGLSGFQTLELSGPWLAPALGNILGFIRAGRAYALIAQANYTQAVGCFIGAGSPVDGATQAVSTATDALIKANNADTFVSTALGLIFVFVPVQPLLISALGETIGARDLLQSIPIFTELQPPQPAASQPTGPKPSATEQRVLDAIARSKRDANGASLVVPSLVPGSLSGLEAVRLRVE